MSDIAQPPTDPPGEAAAATEPGGASTSSDGDSAGQSDSTPIAAAAAAASPPAPAPSEWAQLRAVYAHLSALPPVRRTQVAASLALSPLALAWPQAYAIFFRAVVQRAHITVRYDEQRLLRQGLQQQLDTTTSMPASTAAGACLSHDQDGSDAEKPPAGDKAPAGSALAAAHAHEHEEGLAASVRRALADAARGLPLPLPLPVPLEPAGTRAGDDDEAAKRKSAPAAMPECWGHRGASGAFPENTLASFERAVQDGADGIETDVHITADDVIVMFHDPSLERTTDGTGLIREQRWHGALEHVRTRAKPHQHIPTFDQLCAFLVRPECRHVKANIDIKPDNDPERLFRLMRATIAKYEPASVDAAAGGEPQLAPRIILGLWHPKFLRAALAHVPRLQRIHIGGSPALARQYFWEHCTGFSMSFSALVGAAGQAFLRDARAAGKDVFVWTVNRPDEMVEAARWGVAAILTDDTGLFRDVRASMQDDFGKTRQRQVGRLFRWSSWRYWMLPQYLIQTRWIADLERRAGERFSAAEEKALRDAAARIVEDGAEAQHAQHAHQQRGAVTPATAPGTESTAAAAGAAGANASSLAPPLSRGSSMTGTSGATTAVGSPASLLNKTQQLLQQHPAIDVPAAPLPAAALPIGTA